MASYTITEMYEGRGGGVSGNEAKEGLPCSFNRVFRVISSVENDTIMNVLAATGSPTNIPKMWSEHPETGKSVLKNKIAKQVDAKVWEVTCTYENNLGGGSNDSTKQKPWEQPPDITWDCDTSQIVAEFAYNVKSESGAAPFDDPLNDERGAPTNAILNSAKMPFDPPIMCERSLLAITITKNVRDFNPNDIPYFKGSCNYEKIRIGGVDIGVYCGLMKEFMATKKWHTGSTGDSSRKDRNAYFQLHYKIVVNPETWVHQILDCGMYEYRYSETTHDWNWYAIKDKSTPPKEITQPVPLTTVGGNIVALKLKPVPAADDPKPRYLKYKVFYPTDWACLNLPKEKKEANIKIEDIEI